jgi:hypothetical protein
MPEVNIVTLTNTKEHAEIIMDCSFHKTAEVVE